MVVVAVLAADPVRIALERRIDPQQIAGPVEVGSQRDAAERALGRGYAKALEQLRSTGNVRLPVTASQAAAIQERAIADLNIVRRAALTDLASSTGMGAAAAAYIGAAQVRLDTAAPPDEAGVLLAPGLFAIVSRANQLYSQVAERATRELTTSPSTPVPTPTR